MGGCSVSRFSLSQDSNLDFYPGPCSLYCLCQVIKAICFWIYPSITTAWKERGGEKTEGLCLSRDNIVVNVSSVVKEWNAAPVIQEEWLNTKYTFFPLMSCLNGCLIVLSSCACHYFYILVRTSQKSYFIVHVCGASSRLPVATAFELCHLLEKWPHYIMISVYDLTCRLNPTHILTASQSLQKRIK